MSAAEDYVYPGTQVLKNKADLRDQGELQKFERSVTALRIQELKERPLKGDFSLEHMRDIHRQVFKDVYEWAGEVRKVNMAKGPEGDRTHFALTADIGIKAELIKVSIEEANHLRGMDRKELSSKMGEIYAAVNDLHPFREGNGRVAREYMSELAGKAGYGIDYTKVGRQAWQEAAKASARGNLEPIRQVFYEITTVDRALSFDHAQDRAEQRMAMAKHPDLDAAFKALHTVARDGGDLEAARAAISQELHAGRKIGTAVGVDESRRVIDHAAAYRGLIARDADRLGGQFTGEVVAVSSHHALLKVGDMVAVRYERTNLARDVYVGERLSIQHGKDQSQVYEIGAEPPKDRGLAGMQMERERTLSAS